jgi:hypothetical protein
LAALVLGLGRYARTLSVIRSNSGGTNVTNYATFSDSLVTQRQPKSFIFRVYVTTAGSKFLGHFNLNVFANFV